MLIAANDPQPWLDLSLSNWLSFTQVLLTGLGFWLAWLQLKRTAAAVETSAGLLEKLRVRLLGNDLMVLLPDLHDIDDAIDAALKPGGVGDIERLLVQYSRKGGEILGIIDEQDDLRDDAFAKALRQAVRACVRAKSELAEGSTRTVAQVTSSARTKIATASHEAAALRSRLQRKAD